MYLWGELVAPRDEEELVIWGKFLGQVNVRLAVLIAPESDEALMKRTDGER